MDQASLGMAQTSQKGKNKDRQIDGRIEIPPCVLQDFVPFMVTALLATLRGSTGLWVQESVGPSVLKSL